MDAASADPPVENFYFPGREEYDEAAADPRLDEAFDDEGPGNDLLRHEAYLIEAACARARQQYIDTGTAPRLNDDPAYREFKSEPGAAATGLLSEPSAVADGFTQPIDKANYREPQLQPPATAGGSDKNPPNPLDSMELVIDAYGKERFVESRYENGKLRVWYKHRSDGALLRHEHRGFGSFSEPADPEVFGSCHLNSPPG